MIKLHSQIKQGHGRPSAVTGEELRRIHQSKPPGSEANAVIISTSMHLWRRLATTEELLISLFKTKTKSVSERRTRAETSVSVLGTRPRSASSFPALPWIQWSGQQVALCLVPVSTDNVVNLSLLHPTNHNPSSTGRLWACGGCPRRLPTADLFLIYGSFF